MHSYIFQLSTRPLVEEDYLSEDSAFDKAERYADYVRNIDEKGRAEAITDLICKWLPSDLFESNADGTFTYKGGYEKWIKEVLIPYIKEAAMTLTVDKIASVGFGSSFEVKKRIDNPLNMGSLFVITEENGYNEPAVQSGDFMSGFVSYLKPGTRIFVGGVYDYHY